MKARVKQFMPQLFFDPSILKGRLILKDVLGVSVFALLPGMDSDGIERACSLRAFGSARHPPGHDEALPPHAQVHVEQQVRDYCMGTIKESLAEYEATGVLAHLILEVGSLLYVPAGYLFVERRQ